MLTLTRLSLYLPPVISQGRGGGIGRRWTWSPSVANAWMHRSDRHTGCINVTKDTTAWMQEVEQCQERLPRKSETNIGTYSVENVGNTFSSDRAGAFITGLLVQISYNNFILPGWRNW